MLRRFAMIAPLMACALFLAVPFARAAEDILKLVPESAAGFVVVNKPADLDARLQALARAIQLPPLSPLALLKQQCKIQEGLDEHGTIGLIVLPPENGGMLPAPILLIPVTDYNKFCKPFELGKANEEGVAEVEIFNVQLCTRSIGGYAALADASQREVLFKKNLKIAEKPAAALAPWRQWLASKDVAGVILPPGMKAISTKGQEAIRTMQPILAKAGEQGKMAVGVFDVYAKVLQAAEKEVSACGIGLELDKQNVLRLTKRLLLVPDGQCAQLVAEWHAPTQNLLAGLPDEPFVVAGGGSLTDALYEQLMKFSVNMMKGMRDVYGLSEEKLNQMSATWNQMAKGIHAMSFVLGVGPSGAPIYSNSVAVMRVDDSQKYMERYEKSLVQYNQVVEEAHSPMLPSMKVAKSEVGGIPALQITMKMPQPPTIPQMPESARMSARMMEAMFGPGGELVVWAVAADQHHLVIGYVDKKHVQQTVEAIKQGKPGLESNADVAKTAALLPSDAVLTGYWSPAGTVAFVKHVLPAFATPEANVVGKIPEFPKTPPLGFAVTTGPNEVQSYLVVPTEVLQAIVAYVGKIQAAQSHTPAVKSAEP